MDPLLTEFAKGGAVNLAFGILLIFMLKMLLDERKRSYDESKENARERNAATEERMKSLSTLDKMASAIGKISHTQEMQQATLTRIEDDVKAFKGWRDGRGREGQDR